MGFKYAGLAVLFLSILGFLGLGRAWGHRYLAWGHHPLSNLWCPHTIVGEVNIFTLATPSPTPIKTSLGSSHSSCSCQTGSLSPLRHILVVNDIPDTIWRQLYIGTLTPAPALTRCTKIMMLPCCLQALAFLPYFSGWPFKLEPTFWLRCGKGVNWHSAILFVGCDSIGKILLLIIGYLLLFLLWITSDCSSPCVCFCMRRFAGPSSNLGTVTA